MDFKTLGSHIEYLQAAKRLEEIAYSIPGTPQAHELKELIRLILEFEKDIHSIQVNYPITKLNELD